jgi:hypothetical protein
MLTGKSAFCGVVSWAMAASTYVVAKGIFGKATVQCLVAESVAVGALKYGGLC